MKKKMKMVGYGRVSTDEEKQLDSLEHQILFFSEFAELHNYKLMRVYADEGISGKQLKKRDEFRRMIRDAETGMFDVVVVKDVSRFARNTVDLLTSVRKLKSIGVNVLFVNNNQQTLGESEFVITLLGAMAQEESANLSKRVKFGKDITAKKGRVPRLILGYDKIDNYTMKINEQEAKLVFRIFDMYIKGVGGMWRIANILQQENIKTKMGCNYTEGYIRRILMNPIYYGELVNHKTETIDFIEGKIQKLPENQQYRHNRPELAIVTKEMFDEVQRIRNERRRLQENTDGAPGRRFTNRYLFSGLVRCAHCDRTMFRQNVMRKNGDVVGYWRCPIGSTTQNDDRCINRTHLRDDVLLEAFSKAMQDCIGNKDEFAARIKEEYQKDDADGADGEKKIRDTENEIEKCKQTKEKYLEMYANEVITMEELKKKTEVITKQIKSKEERLAEIKRHNRVMQNVAQSIDECVQEIERFLRLENITNQEVRSVVSRVDVWKDHKIVIIFKVLEEESL